jgi:predicted DNA-binding helix-hairpin-helix protein
MNATDKLNILSRQMQLEAAEDINCPKLSHRQKNETYISHAILPNGQRISLLKTLLTSVCERDCNYCPFRAGRDLRRASFQPEEFARLFMYMHNSHIAEGIFLSSGVIGGGIHAQDKLLDTADILRNKLGYLGYLHLKIMPGAEINQVERAMLLADRISINLEAPNTERLHRLSPSKQFVKELFQPLQWANKIRHNKSPMNAWKKRWPSVVTQFVVGGADESDLELLHTTEYLHRKEGLSRAYYSAFNPIPDTPLEEHPPTPPKREHRLYQASFLIRDYGFSLEELAFNPSGNLPLNCDPKKAWANSNLKHLPIEINTATQDKLLRIPGIGPKGAKAIMNARRDRTIDDLSSLRKIGIMVEKSVSYILINGKRPAQQQSFW